MTGTQIRQSFIDFFKERYHTVVPSSSLLPDDPNLPFFINAGMNQFVPFFLGEQPLPFSPGRAANTQKCIRAGGKHNDLEDVGQDTYHHTFFEMLGNWSFGDYFKREAIEWAWELLTGVWGLPKERLYMTVYRPEHGEPGVEDAEARAIWADVCKSAGLDPEQHVQYFGKSDNFWMMGDTGPCGPCSEVHIDLTPAGDTGGRLVNEGDHRCIEIWNLVFIQNNATPAGGFEELPAKHVDTGMGFERVAAVMQCTDNLTDFSRIVSNYDTDIFEPLFDAVSDLSGYKYCGTLPGVQFEPDSQWQDKDAYRAQVQADVAFRVIADHVRCLTAAISDGIYPENVGRGYVLRRILRRAVRYGRSLDLTEPFMCRLVAVVADGLSSVFPSMVENQEKVARIIRAEEESFGRTLDRGLTLFQEVKAAAIQENGTAISGDEAFKLYATYGFPLDLTELMSREAGLSVDVERFDALMDEHQKLGQAGSRKSVIEVVSDDLEIAPTVFTGYESLEETATVQQVLRLEKGAGVILDRSPFYAEMGGQVGDRGVMDADGSQIPVVDTQPMAGANVHLVGDAEGSPAEGDTVEARVDGPTRHAIERHHTATHLLHWALREVVGRDAAQQGSFVGPDYLRFDFNHHSAVSPVELETVERLVNERVIDNASVHWFERPRNEIQNNKEINQFFGDKYGDVVRVVQIGGSAGNLNGYSKELCGGTHTRSTGDIGLFVLTHESAIAAGIRRIEALAGHSALDHIQNRMQVLGGISSRLSTPVSELDKRIENLIDNQRRLEKELSAMQRKVAATAIDSMIGSAETINDIPLLVADVSDQDSKPRDILELILQKMDRGIVVLGSSKGGSCSFVCSVSRDLTDGGWHAGNLAQEVAQVAGGGGGGGAEKAQAGGRDASKLGDALAKAQEIIKAKA